MEGEAMEVEVEEEEEEEVEVEVEVEGNAENGRDKGEASNSDTEDAVSERRCGRTRALRGETVHGLMLCTRDGGGGGEIEERGGRAAAVRRGPWKLSHVRCFLAYPLRLGRGKGKGGDDSLCVLGSSPPFFLSRRRRRGC